MNNTLLFIVIAIIAVAIIALIFLQKLQKNQGKSPRVPSIDKQPTIKPADPRLLSDADIANALSAQQTLPQAEPQLVQTKPQDELAKIDGLIQSQDYQTAISELKHLLMTNPRHTTAMLKLLQVYGLTKQYTPFNQLHQKICEIADEKTVQDANFFKSLIDEEIASTQSTPKPAPQPVQIDTLEFDIPQERPKTAKPMPIDTPTADDEVFELDFDVDENSNTAKPASSSTTTSQADDLVDLEELDFNFDTPTQATPTHQNDTTNLDEFILDDSLNAPKTQNTAQQNSQTAVQAHHDDLEELGFDFNFDDTKAEVSAQTPTQSSQPSADDKPLDFSFDTADQDNQAFNQKISQPSATQNDLKDTTTADEFDFSSLSLDNADNSHDKNHKKDEPSQLNDGFDFDFNTDTVSANTNKSADDELSAFTLDTKQDQKQDDTNANEFDFSSLSLDGETPAQPAQKDHHKTSDEPDSELGFDFDFGETVNTKADETDKAFNDNAFDLSANLDETKSIAHHKADEFEFDFSQDLSQTTSPTIADVQQDFDIQEPSFDLDKDIKDDVTHKLELDTADKSDFTLSLDGQQDTAHDTSKQPTDDFGLNDLTLDGTITPTSQHDMARDDSLDLVSSHKPTPDTQHDGIDFSFGDDTTTAVDTTNDIKTNADLDLPKHHDAISFDWQDDDITPQVDTKAEPQFVAPVVSPEPKPEPVVQEIPVVITPSTLEASLSTPSDDSIQVTLELAKQYIEFGEYDGAKHLLQEVAQEGSASQKQEAHSLMIGLA